MRAVVDIGSNSVKYTVANSNRGALEIVKSASWVTRLGKDLKKTGRLDPESVKATEEAFRQMKTELAALGEMPIAIVGTSAMREATNPEEITQPAHHIFNTPVKILSGQEEAKFSIKGAGAAARILLHDDDAVFIDVGGASTEVGIQKPFLAHSFQAGAVRCHEALGFDAPVSDVKWAEAPREMEKFFPEKDWLGLQGIFSRPRPTVAVGGTLVLAGRLAGASGTPGVGLKTTMSDLDKLNERLRKLSLAERLKLPFMQPGRADIICAGILCLSVVMKKLGTQDVAITEWGLRHGILLTEFENEK